MIAWSAIRRCREDVRARTTACWNGQEAAKVWTSTDTTGRSPGGQRASLRIRTRTALRRSTTAADRQLPDGMKIGWRLASAGGRQDPQLPKSTIDFFKNTRLVDNPLREIQKQFPDLNLEDFFFLQLENKQDRQMYEVQELDGAGQWVKKSEISVDLVVGRDPRNKKTEVRYGRVELEGDHVSAGQLNARQQAALAGSDWKGPHKANDTRDPRFAASSEVTKIRGYGVALQSYRPSRRRARSPPAQSSWPVANPLRPCKLMPGPPHASEERQAAGSCSAERSRRRGPAAAGIERRPPEDRRHPRSVPGARRRSTTDVPPTTASHERSRPPRSQERRGGGAAHRSPRPVDDARPIVRIGIGPERPGQVRLLHLPRSASDPKKGYLLHQFADRAHQGGDRQGAADHRGDVRRRPSWLSGRQEGRRAHLRLGRQDLERLLARP
jgi:hypothetical protein